MVVIISAAPPDLSAQDAADHYPQYWLDEIVAVIDRGRTRLIEATVPAYVLTRSRLEQLPVRDVAGALRYVPGLLFVDGHGFGNSPVPVARGFFGGGETEYVLVLLDGIPVNYFRTGIADLRQISLSSIDRIEVLRGSGSSAYGDAALGAVINILTRTGVPEKRGSAGLVVGQQGEQRFGAAYLLSSGRHRVRVLGNGRRTDGFRSHSGWRNLLLDGLYRFQPNADNSLSIGLKAQTARADSPGPLTEDEVEEGRRRNSPLFDLDRRRRNYVEGNLDIQHELGHGNRLVAHVGVRAVDQEETRTLQLAPGLGDAQLHDERNLELWALTNFSVGTELASLIAGIDGMYGGYQSEYYDDQNRESLLTEGNGSRGKLGLFVEAKRTFSDRWRASAGLRYDLIADSHRASSSDPAGARFHQWSPRLAVNVAYLSSPSYPGNAYLSWARAFKAPTLDQLFGERAIRVDEAGSTINFSNGQLSPQRSNALEVGIYQKLPLLSGRFSGELTLSVYRIDVRDEIDFDLSTLRYGNIQRSRHDGLEGSLAFYVLPRISVSSSINVIDVTFLSGDHVGNRLKNIPKRSIITDVVVNVSGSAQLSSVHTYSGEVFLDDANTSTLPAFHTFDTKLVIRKGRIRLHFMIRNVTDNEYNASGYVLYDPFAMQNVRYLYPAEGRYIEAGIDLTL